MYGNAFQSYHAMGYVGNDFDLGVVGDHFVIYFNFHTKMSTGELSRINCRISGDLAKTFHDEFRRGDTIVLQGEFFHKYDADAKVFTNKLAVTGYAWIDDFAKPIPVLSEEKAIFMAKMEYIYDNNAPKPTEEDVLKARERFLEKRKLNKKKGV
jgi:hypothetical protein